MSYLDGIGEIRHSRWSPEKTIAKNPWTLQLNSQCWGSMQIGCCSPKKASNYMILHVTTIAGILCFSLSLSLCHQFLWEPSTYLAIDDLLQPSVLFHLSHLFFYFAQLAGSFQDFSSRRSAGIIVKPAFKRAAGIESAALGTATTDGNSFGTATHNLLAFEIGDSTLLHYKRCINC